MERYNQILHHKKYRCYLEKNNREEADRRFCRHNMGHFLDVARIGMILNETEGYGLSKDLVYAAALLHDVGRWMQYQNGTPHERAGVMLAGEILTDCCYGEAEKEQILTAIGNHRNADKKEEKSLSGLLYRSDKLSRACFACGAQKECGWKQDKKNLEIIW